LVALRLSGERRDLRESWGTLQSSIGVAPESLLGAPAAKLILALRAGGMVPEIRAALKKFPNIADPGADRIRLGRERENYGRNYAEGQAIIEAETPASFDARTRAYLLVKWHGQQLCKRTNPKCGECPVRISCSFG
jgi:hypothetical protein